MAVVEGVLATVNPSLNPFLGLSGNRQVLSRPEENSNVERANSSTFADRPAPACGQGNHRRERAGLSRHVDGEVIDKNAEQGESRNAISRQYPSPTTLVMRRLGTNSPRGVVRGIAYNLLLHRTLQNQTPQILLQNAVESGGESSSRVLRLRSPTVEHRRQMGTSCGAFQFHALDDPNS